MSKPQIVILSDTVIEVARGIQASIGGVIAGLEGRVTMADVTFEDTKAFLHERFVKGSNLICVMASGAVIRMLVDVIDNKFTEPAVICVSEDGSSVVPLLGGHHGANDMARKIASHINGHAAITTAGDLRFGIALDEPPAGYVLANPEEAKTAMAELINGACAKLSGVCDWISSSKIPLDNAGSVKLTVTGENRKAEPLELVYHPAVHIVGVGCERGCDAQEVIALVEQAVNEAGIAKKSIAAIASIDLKADEVALHKVANHFEVPFKVFDADTLEEEKERLANPSEIVFEEVGCHGVSEGAALAGVGPGGFLVLPKRKSKRATVAIGRAPEVIDANQLGRSRGKLFVVGIGPGKEGWRSPEVTKMVSASTDLVGYSLYLDIISGISKGKTRHDFDLGKEEDRVRHAMELAGKGKDVALVCSGDAGIYAMATLVFELLENGGLSDAASRIEIQVSPGISALQAAASKIGAPLGHDFCTISLSDLLTPWEAIQMRVKAAAEGDFVIAFYNPVSKRRRTQLAYARDELLKHRPQNTPVVLATNLGREGEFVRVVPLAKLNIDDVDMLTVVVVGSSDSRVVKTGDGREWVYTPRGYAAKIGTKINHEAAE